MIAHHYTVVLGSRSNSIWCDCNRRRRRRWWCYIGSAAMDMRPIQCGREIFRTRSFFFCSSSCPAFNPFIVWCMRNELPYCDSNDHDNRHHNHNFKPKNLISAHFDLFRLWNDLDFSLFFSSSSLLMWNETNGRKKEEQNPIDNDADDETGLCSFERIFKLNQKFLFH